MQTKLPFFTLLLLISFASVNAVLFTPALPTIAYFFGISEDTAQQTITWFLVGYTVGQLLYGPLANRFGRKPGLYAGISLQIISSLLCVASGVIHAYWLLVVARFIMAIGAGVGLKMTYTLVNECYEPKVAGQKLSYLILAFAITPGLGVAIGGFLNTYWGWMSCFYASAIYGLVLLLLVTRLPETQKNLDFNALKITHLLHGYSTQFKNKRLVVGGLLMGTTACFIYVFAALAPFIAINLFHMQSDDYGLANCIPTIGLIAGSLVSARLSKTHSFESIIQMGIRIASMGVLLMFMAMLANIPLLFSLFLPMIIIYFGLCFILAHTSMIAMEGIVDKAHGAAVMSFINMGLATLAVFALALFPIKTLLLPTIYLVLCVAMFGIFKCLRLIPVVNNQL
jgi:DHA1 family bicyclomycin/chloramphenicol resistance-like MFS transporter